MFHKYVKLLIENSRRISSEKLTVTGNISELRKGFPNEYKGLEVKTGFGQGNWADVTWIGFLTEGQTIQTGIYPVYLYYRDRDVLILAYGVSETNKPNIEWDVPNAHTVKSYFAKTDAPLKKYTKSLVYKAYTTEDLKNITDDFDQDLDSLIDYYKTFMANNASITPANNVYNKIKNQVYHLPLQTIYFGSPGTGKSYGIKEELKEKGIDEEKKINTDRLFRTTFHPDTDYSAFVGCYKPICNQVKLNIKDITQLKAEAQVLINEITQKPGAKVEMLSTFMADNAEPLLKAEADGNSWKSILEQVFSKGYINNDSYLHSLCKIVAEINDRQTTSISYKFTPQVFALAYEKAWNLLNSPDKSADEKQIYLVIEEINRGNCAQIFGDLFQLLDRKNDGYSEYPVKADTDLYNYLISLEGWGKNHPGILNGNLCLPPNLNIIATMNTSDQSLFPMDSAFKRRWDWKYIPTTAQVGEEFDITIDAGDKEYSWKLFLEKINEMILRATNSEDKQLGFWFVKADKSTKQIPTSTFVSKVVFYLWNDVFKDMGAKGTNPFTISYEGKNEIMSFNSFFEIKPDGKIAENIGVLHSFLKNVGLEPK